MYFILKGLLKPVTWKRLLVGCLFQRKSNAGLCNSDLYRDTAPLSSSSVLPKVAQSSPNLYGLASRGEYIFRRRALRTLDTALNNTTLRPHLDLFACGLSLLIISVLIKVAAWTVVNQPLASGSRPRFTICKQQSLGELVARRDQATRHCFRQQTCIWTCLLENQGRCFSSRKEQNFEQSKSNIFALGGWDWIGATKKIAVVFAPLGSPRR